MSPTVRVVQAWWIAWLIGVAPTPTPAFGQAPLDDVPRAQILLLGTFHFDDPGLDTYRPRFPWNPVTPDHQREIEEVVELLARFRPTRIALEWPWSRQAGLDSLRGVAGRPGDSGAKRAGAARVPAGAPPRAPAGVCGGCPGPLLRA